MGAQKQKKQEKLCFLDTEFNTVDTANQNDGIQEITEIGAVIFQNGKITDRFYKKCLLANGHKLTKRCKKITGITTEDLIRDGVQFLEAMNQLRQFLDRHNIRKVYVFGGADTLELRNSAKYNNAESNVYNTIKMMVNVYPIFERTLSLHYVFSLTDICRICYIDHEAPGRAHSALTDAEDTGFAFINMKQEKINNQLLHEINEHKYHVKLYRENRSVKFANIRKLDIVTDTFIENIDQVIRNAEQIIGTPIATALHDDMMRVIGRPDLEIGEEKL